MRRSWPIKRPLALTLGDPAGIGPDITLLAWAARTRDAGSALRAARRSRRAG